MNEPHTTPLPTSSVVLTTIDKASYQLTSCSTHESLSSLVTQISSENNISSNLMSPQIFIHTNSTELLALNSLKMMNRPLPSFDQLMELLQSSWISNFLLNINTILLYLRPAMSTLLQQKATLDHIVKNLYKCLGTIAFPIGVAITHVILPHEKIDMTVFLPNPVDPKWHLKFHEALLSDNPLENPPQLHSVSFQSKDKSATLTYGDIHVNITVNDIAALYNSALYEDVDVFLSSDGLMKTSYLLIKSWIVNDSDLPTGSSLSISPVPSPLPLPSSSSLSSPSSILAKLYPTILTGKVLQVLVFNVFCRYGHLISHPFIALLLFLYHYSTFDFESSTIDLESALNAYQEMITLDPTLEMKYQSRAQCTAASVQTLIASCVGVSTETLDPKPDETTSTSTTTTATSTEEHPRSKQHHHCPPHLMVEKIRSRLFDYRARYEAILHSYTQILDDPNFEGSGNVAYGTDPHYHYLEDPHSGLKINPATNLFQRSRMNVADPICNYHNLSEHVTASDVKLIKSVFSLGLQKMVFHLEKVNTHFSSPPSTEPNITNNNNNNNTTPSTISSTTNTTTTSINFDINKEEDPLSKIDTSLIPQSPPLPLPQPPPPPPSPVIDPFECFLFHCFGKTRHISIRHKCQAVTVHDLAFIEQLKKNPCYRDNAIVSPPDILLKQGEFILMGIQNATGQLQITPTAVANLIVQCLERYGPQLVGDIGKQLQDLTGIPNLPKILKAKYRGLKKVIEAFPNLFQIGTDHIINPTIFLKEPRRPGPIVEPETSSPNSRMLSDFVNVAAQSNPQFQSNRNQGQQSGGGGPQSYSQYPNAGGGSGRGNQDNSKWKYSNSNPRQHDNYYRTNSGPSNSGYNNNHHHRGGGGGGGMMHPENDEQFDDRQYYYEQYGGGYGGGGGGQGHSRAYSNNYAPAPAPAPAPRNQQYNSRDPRGSQQYSEYDYDPRWNQQQPQQQQQQQQQQQDMSRQRSTQQSHRDAYGTDTTNMYPLERNLPRDNRYNPSQNWGSYQEYENPPVQRNPTTFYPQRGGGGSAGGGRQPDEILSHDFDDYRRTGDYDSSSLSQFNPSRTAQEKQSSGWLDIEGLIGNADATDQYTGLDGSLDINFQL